MFLKSCIIAIAFLPAMHSYAFQKRLTNQLAVDEIPLQKIVYSKQDSIKIEQLLREPCKGQNLVLFYARKFKGVPYVAHTLEVADPEKLVVNLTRLDCTTLVETACALAKAKKTHQLSFQGFCKALASLRYREGKIKGYLSRLHYFTWWMHSNIARHNVAEVVIPRKYRKPIVINDYYMSKNFKKYKILKRHPGWVKDIRRMERAMNGKDGYYLPEYAINYSPKQLSFIHDGDIIAIVTTKKGIDYSHLGLAAWGKDHKLHLLNASSLYHKVVEDPHTFYSYLRKHPSSIGIRLLRLK